MMGKRLVYLGCGATVVMACALFWTLACTMASAAWTEQAILYSSDGADAGSVYVFEKDDGTGVWSQIAKLYGSNTNAGDNFGTRICMDGNTALIGANQADGIAGQTGATYVFIVPEPAAVTLLVMLGLALLAFTINRK